MNRSKTIQQLQAQLITPENFRPYGQVIFASKDGKPFDGEDAQLMLDKGTPRFYIMQLHCRGRKFHKITRHMQCTQCLGSLEGKEWLIGVCPPNNNVEVPDLKNIAAFRIPGNCFIKLNVGTWHAGPYFEHRFVDFYNLELSDTNVVDHFTYDFLKHQNLEFEIV
ncbi:MAG: ureidoglycolate lyase [Nostocaceae cyanobacterium]|nr:ureidoglycolate lyase [Nostocaceae cyanobacterium]